MQEMFGILQDIIYIEECEKYHIDIAPYRLNVGGYFN